jgi:hypothetical protein
MSTCLLYSSLCCPWRCLACSCMLVLQMHVFVQQQTLLCQEVYGLQHPSLCCMTASLLTVCTSLYISWACLFTWAFVLHLACLSTRALCCTWMCLPTRAVCCTWTCLSTRTFAVPVRVCLQELCDAPGRVCLQEYRQHWNCRCSAINIFLVCFGLFRNRYVYFGCFDTCSKHRNKPKKLFFGFVKQTETQPKQIVFRFFSVRTENIFCLFRGHPNSASTKFKSA